MNYRQPFEGSYQITQGYGDTDTSAFHTGIDYACPTGTPILASEAGTVMFAGWDNTGYGNCVIIQHKDGKATLYAHLQSISVKTGQKVKRSQVIGYSDSTGNSTGPHLHFEMRDASGKAINPMTMLHSSIEPPTGGNPLPPSKPDLKGPDALGEKVKVICTLGAKGWYDDFQKYDVFPQGTDLTYTGKTKKHNGYTYCECYPTPRMFWVAVNDGETQILDNRE